MNLPFLGNRRDELIKELMFHTDCYMVFAANPSKLFSYISGEYQRSNGLVVKKERCGDG